ncbi:PucR family transcriptional regulator [Acrocarpospora macrocephala]|uniref:PucR family transcriptional regulator n=1 Tax=Acrocarpospora macrocephala TaxID=150177 RepID=UPI0012D3467F|nr:PucR family transcriptional regulator [Acrocarpospora macrocephala]
MGDDVLVNRITEPRDGIFDSRPLPMSVRDSAIDFDVPTMVDVVVERCSTVVFTSHRRDEAFLERLRASVAQNAYALRDVLAGRVELEDVRLDQVLSFATVQAQLRIPQKSMQRSYRVSFLTQWEMWTAHLRRRIEREDLDRDAAADALAHLTRVILTYQDHVASQVAETYTRDYEALSRSRAHVRQNLVRDILRGEEARLTASDMAILAYQIDGHHVAVLLPAMTEGAATQLADGLRMTAKAYQTMSYPLALSSTVVWLCRLEPWGVPGLSELCRVLAEVGVTASVSDPQQGMDGFRAALRQAEEVERVRAAWGPLNAPPVIRYADAGLEVLLLQNDALARTFVDSELGALAVNTTEAIRLRETLEASFRFGSHVAAAEHLQLHEHTVRNRLQKAEQLLGHSLQDRRTELQVAIRLVRLLGDDSARQETPQGGGKLGRSL